MATKSANVTFDYPFEADDGTERVVKITANVYPGFAGTWYKKNGDPGDPPEPPGVDILHVEESGKEVSVESLPPDVLQDVELKAFETAETTYNHDEP